MNSFSRALNSAARREAPAARPSAGTSAKNPLPPLQPHFTPSDASLEVLQLLNVEGGQQTQTAEDAVRHTLQEWLRTYDAEQNQYASVTVFAEMKLRQALVVTSKLGLPNAVRTAAVCSCFDRVASLFHRYEGLLRTLRGEMLRAIYVDFRPGAVMGGGAQAYSMCTPYFEELRKEKRKTAELHTMIKQWGDERISSLRLVDERRRALDVVIEQLKKVVQAGAEQQQAQAHAAAAQQQQESSSSSAAAAAAPGAAEAGGAEEGRAETEASSHDRLLQLIPDIEAAVEALRQEQETAFLDPVSKITQLQEGLSQYQQLRHLQKVLRELGPTLMVELPPAERANMAAALLEQVPDGEQQQLLLNLLLLRPPEQLVEVLDATAAELDAGLASQLLFKCAERCWDPTGKAAAPANRRLSVSARRASLAGGHGRRASGAAGASSGGAPPAPVAFASFVTGVLKAAPDVERATALKTALASEAVVPAAKRHELAAALGAPVGEIGALQEELAKTRAELGALQRDLAPPPPPEPMRFRALFGVTLPPSLPAAGGGAAVEHGEGGVLPLHAVRQRIAELYAAKLAELDAAPPMTTAAADDGAAGGGAAPPRPFARLAYETMLRRCGLRSAAKQQLLHLLAALTHHAIEGHAPQLLLIDQLCGLSGAAAPWAAPKAAFFFALLAALLALQPNITLHALLAQPRAVVPLSGVRQLATALLSGDSCRRLLDTLQQLHDNPTARLPPAVGAGGIGDPAGTLEELLPRFVEAWDLDHAHAEQRLRSAFAAAQPPSGVFTLDAFTALVSSLDGAAALPDATIIAMYQQALECSGGLLDESESDILLLEAFVYVCQEHGL